MAVGTKETTQTAKAKNAARVAATKEAMSGITKAKQEEAKAAGASVGALQQAYQGAEGDTKLGIQSAMARQLALQGGLGSGANKAAARQAAADIGTSTGLAMSNLKLGQAKDVGAAEKSAAEARTEAAAQAYEQLTGEAKLEKAVAEEEMGAGVDLNKMMDDEIASTKDWDDDEQLAVSKLITLYNTQQAAFEANPESKKALLNKIAGIYKDAIDEDWEDIDTATKDFLTSQGFSKADWNAATELDY